MRDGHRERRPPAGDREGKEPAGDRAVVAGILRRWMEKGTFPDHMMESVRSHRAFVTEVVYGAIKWKRALEWAVGLYAGRPPSQPVMAHLLAGTYQALKMDTVADYAIVNETVATARRDPMVPQNATGFINGVLRKIVSERVAIVSKLAEQPLAVRESHPNVLVERWLSTYGTERTETLCRWNNGRPEVTCRLRRLAVSEDEFVKTAAAAGMTIERHAYDADCFVLPRGVNVRDVPGYAEGWFAVQDPSTLMPVRLLDPKPGETVLDACAAPGGKTALIGDILGCGGEGLTAMDFHAGRIETMKTNLRRMKLDAVRVTQGDASDFNSMEKALGHVKFDRILLDVPCTNTGVLRRRADARWRFSMSRMEEAVRVQAAMLETAARFLKPGGILVYATCSLEPEENGRQIAVGVESTPGLELEDSSVLFPPETKTDAAYAARIRKH